MTSESAGILSSPDRSSSPSLIEESVHDYCTTNQMFTDFTGVMPQQIRSPGKRSLTIEESFITTNDPKRVCNRYMRLTIPLISQCKLLIHSKNPIQLECFRFG